MDAAYKQALESNRHEPTNYKNSSHKDGVFEVLQSLRKNEKFCDIKLQTDDGKIIFGHKNILVSASPYFNAMFSNFNESNKDLVNIRKLDFHILQLLIDYIYTGEIIVTEKHVQGLLPAANLLQLEYVTSACADFLITQLDPSNCLGIQRFADVHNCVELLISSEAYIKKQFLEVVQFDEFLSLSSEEVIKLISCDDLFVPLEEKVFECVINWVKYELKCRKDFLPNLMEHVRLPLASKQYILEKVVDEPLFKNSPKYYVFEALQFYVLKSVYPFTIPQTIRSTPRKSGGLQKIVLALSYSSAMQKSFTNWFDPFINLWQIAPGMTKSRNKAGLGVIKDTFVLALGDVINSSSQSVEMLDLSSQSPCWVQIVDMLVSRQHLGVGILNDSIYAVGGHDGTSYLNSVEVFDVSIQKWKMVSSMSIRRSHFGVGVLNNLLYAVGGFNGTVLKSVECYNPSVDTWTPVAEMSVNRNGFGIRILDGVMYAIGGINGTVAHKSVEIYRPSTGVWTPIANMHLSRHNPGVFTLDGLLYVIGGEQNSTILNSVEIYNPDTNTWSMETLPVSGTKIYGAVVVNRPPYFRTN
eukprot:XP_016658905.1 PREDICTED: ring canal kelch homolog isoform X2 [Acyrthosiphon pisum]